MKRLDREIKETIIFTITPRIKYTGINLLKEAKDCALNKGEDLHSAFEFARSRMEDEIHYKEWKYNSGRMRGEYVDRHDAIYSLPRYRNAFILIDNI